MASVLNIIDTAFSGKKGKADYYFSKMYVEKGKIPDKDDFLKETGLSDSSYYRAKKRYEKNGISDTPVITMSTGKADRVYAQLYLENHRSPTKEEFKNASGMSDRSYFRAQKKFKEGLKEQLLDVKTNIVSKEIASDLKNYNKNFSGVNAEYFGTFLATYEKMRVFMKTGMSIDELSEHFARHSSGNSDENKGYQLFVSGFHNMVDMMQSEIDELKQDKDADKHEIDKRVKLLDDAVNAWNDFTGYKERQKRLKELRKKIGLKV